MIIRNMTKEDLPQICTIEKETFTQPWSEEDFRNAMNNDRNCYLVAEAEQGIVGYCGYWGIVGEGDIYNVAVKKEHRGQRIGYHMLFTLINEAKSRGITSLTLEVRSSNTPAICLYESLGFEQAGIRKDFYSKPKEDAVIMWLNSIQ